MTFRDRVKELRRVPAGELRANPKNARDHDEAQRAAIKGVLGQLGFAGAALAREDVDGSLIVLDGHLRQDVTDAEQEIPVLILDITEAEEALFLATFDPIGAMATENAQQMAALLKFADGSEPAVVELLDKLAAENDKRMEELRLEVQSQDSASLRSSDRRTVTLAFDEAGLRKFKSAVGAVAKACKKENYADAVLAALEIAKAHLPTRKQTARK